MLLYGIFGHIFFFFIFLFIFCSILKYYYYFPHIFRLYINFLSIFYLILIVLFFIFIMYHIIYQKYFYVFIDDDRFFLLKENNFFLIFYLANCLVLYLDSHYLFPFIFIFISITTVSIIFCLSYNWEELWSFVFYVFIILLVGAIILIINSIFIFFFFYEMLLLPSFLILYRFAKTRRAIEASYIMFFWTQFGAMFLFFSFLYLFLVSNCFLFSDLKACSFSLFEVNFLLFLWLLGFGVKIPIWPFYAWLPKAHVEASTNFSIFLSGVLVKFAFFGLLRCIILLGLESTFYYIFIFIFVGLCDSVFKLFYQLDLKKLIAFSTVVEMHWLIICLLTGQLFLYYAVFSMIISHAILSSNSFLLVDAISRRFHTRLINEMQGLFFLLPNLYSSTYANCIFFLGFPGTIFFIAELLFFSFSIDLFPILGFLLYFLLYFIMPILFFKAWMNVLFSFSRYSNWFQLLDLEQAELVLFMFLYTLLFLFGLGSSMLINSLLIGLFVLNSLNPFNLISNISAIIYLV